MRWTDDVWVDASSIGVLVAGELPGFKVNWAKLILEHSAQRLLGFLGEVREEEDR